MNDWIWLPHAAHFCASEHCRFRLATYVNGVIVSTVGEYFPPGAIRPQEIGARRRYETVVFDTRPATEDDCAVCPFVIDPPREIDFDAYNTAQDAYEGHLALCHKWASTPVSGSADEVAKGQDGPG